MTSEGARKAWATRKRNAKGQHIPPIKDQAPTLDAKTIAKIHQLTAEPSQDQLKEWKFKREFIECRQLCRILLSRMEDLERRLRTETPR